MQKARKLNSFRAFWYTVRMNENTKALVFDMDDTLAVSKSAVTPEMAEVLCKLLPHFYIGVISGAGFPQFEKQIISQLKCNDERLTKLIMFPQNGSVMHRFEEGTWKQIAFKGDQVMRNLTEQEAEKITIVLNKLLADFNYPDKTEHGDVIENRGAQITLSLLGKNAPIELKRPWDPDQKKRIEMRNILLPELPEFEIHIGGTTSIDITQKGISKAFAIEKLFETLPSLKKEEILFFGDAIFPGGNDEPVANMGIPSIKVKNSEDTLEKLKEILGNLKK